MKPTYEQLEAEVHALRAEVSELKAYILRLEEIIKQNSKNSSKPPSSDQKANLPPKIPKKRGPPFGHPFYQRTLFSPEQVKERVVVKDLFCKECGSTTQVIEDAPLIHQQVEIPPSSFYVCQIERYYSYCPVCHKKRAASFPEHENLTGFGTRLTSFVALCTGQYRLGCNQKC
jgi:transposase